MLRLFALAFLLGLASPVAFDAAARAQTADAAASGQSLSYIVTGDDYFLKEGDVIEVTVREDPSLNRRLMIGPDGKVNMTLAGIVIAAGNTVQAVQDDIFRRLQSSFVSAPTVTVSLVALAETASDGGAGDLGTKTIYVLGEVARPGPYDVERSIAVLQALSLAGGFGDFAAKSRIQIRRRVDGREVLQFFDYDEVEAGEITQSNIELVDGDVIVVPKRGLFE